MKNECATVEETLTVNGKEFSVAKRKVDVLNLVVAELKRDVSKVQLAIENISYELSMCKDKKKKVMGQLLKTAKSVREAEHSMEELREEEKLRIMVMELCDLEVNKYTQKKAERDTKFMEQFEIELQKKQLQGLKMQRDGFQGQNLSKMLSHLKTALAEAETKKKNLKETECTQMRNVDTLNVEIKKICLEKKMHLRKNKARKLRVQNHIAQIVTEVGELHEKISKISQ